MPLPADLRRALADERLADLAALARTGAALGRFFADALGGLLERHPAPPDLIGSHGQTVYHEHAVATSAAGRAGASGRCASSARWSMIFAPTTSRSGARARRWCPMSTTGCWAAAARRCCAVNIGGIANFTALPAAGDDRDAVLGMDCGPGNMLLDQIARRFSGGKLAADIDGRLAARGAVRPELLAELCAHPFFTAPPPKSAGREQFGAPFVEALLAKVRPDSEQAWCDLLATATELTAFGVRRLLSAARGAAAAGRGGRDQRRRRSQS